MNTTQTTQERVIELTAMLNRPFLAEYAYPTSDTARTYGKSRTGCWFVSGRNGIKPRFLASSHGYDTQEEAAAFANIMNQEATITNTNRHS